MKIKYYADTDTMRIRLKSGTTEDTVDIAPGVVIDVDAEGHVLGIEIYEAASQKVDLADLHVDGLAVSLSLQKQSEAAG